MTYTPTPWHILREGDGVIAIGNKSLPHVAVVRYSHNPALSKETGKANAAHIVKCVNLHDQMLITIGKLASGMKRGDEGWSKLDEEVYQLAMEAPHA